MLIFPTPTPLRVIQFHKSTYDCDRRTTRLNDYKVHSRVARLAFLCQLSQIWHILNWLAIKISCWHFRLKCKRVIFFFFLIIFLLPTTFQFAKFEKVGIKMPIWQPWCTALLLFKRNLHSVRYEMRVHGILTSLLLLSNSRDVTHKSMDTIIKPVMAVTTRIMHLLQSILFSNECFLVSGYLEVHILS